MEREEKFYNTAKDRVAREYRGSPYYPEGYRDWDHMCSTYDSGHPPLECYELAALYAIEDAFDEGYSLAY